MSRQRHSDDGGDRPHVAVVLLNWNSWADTVECLESLVSADYPALDVVVVDNHSTNDSIPQLTRWFEEREADFPGARGFQVLRVGDRPDGGDAQKRRFVTLLENSSNAGFSAGNNVGIGSALRSGVHYVMLLNNDTTVAPDFLTHMVDEAERWQGAAVVAPRITYYDRPDEVWYGGANTGWLKGTATPSGMPHEDHEVSFVTGAGVLIPAAILHRLGGLDEDFFFGCEDYEYSARLRRAGVRLRYSHRAEVRHKVGRSRETNESALYWGYKAQSLYKRKTLSKASFLAWMLVTCVYLATVAPFARGFSGLAGWWVSVRRTLAGHFDGSRGMPVTREDLAGAGSLR